MPDVDLWTEGSEAEVAVTHLTLTFLDSGLALDKADGEAVWESPWEGLEEMSPLERSVMATGGVAASMVSTTLAALALITARLLSAAHLIHS